MGITKMTKPQLQEEVRNLRADLQRLSEERNAAINDVLQQRMATKVAEDIAASRQRRIFNLEDELEGVRKQPFRNLWDWAWRSE